MKKLLLLLIPAAFLSGCSDVLDTYPNDRYTQETYWTTEANAVAALSGCYAMLRADGTFGGDATPLWEETATPNAYNYDNSMGFNVIAQGIQTAVNSGIINNRYPDSYRGIGRCNTLLGNIDRVPMDETLKTRMKAEAKFLRAVYYSLLEMYYGGVPLILEAPNLDQSFLPRNTRQEVVAQILKDLDEAAAVLPVSYTGSNIGRATKGAALAFKTRVLLFEASPLNNTSNWIEVAAAAKAVMDLAPTAGYDLYANYRNLFLPAFENNKEVIFDVQFMAPEQDGNSFDLINRQYNTNAPLRDLINAYPMKDGLSISESPLYNPAKPYENRDPRFYQTIIYPGRVFMGNVTTPTNPFKITGYSFQKYNIYDENPTSNILNTKQSETNYIVLRYADILLMFAEAQNEAVGPDAAVYNAVNKIRQRAGLVPFALPSGLTKEQMREAIRHERRIEFAGEGLYYLDIRRWKTAQTVMNATIHTSENAPIVTRTFDPDKDYWWPLPQAELDLNENLEQNEPY